MCVCRYLKLPNGLKALLISDVTTDKASAALSVRIGEPGCTLGSHQRKRAHIHLIAAVDPPWSGHLYPRGRKVCRIDSPDKALCGFPPDPLPACQQCNYVIVLLVLWQFPLRGSFTKERGACFCSCYACNNITFPSGFCHKLIDYGH